MKVFLTVAAVGVLATAYLLMWPSKTRAQSADMALFPSPYLLSAENVVFRDADSGIQARRSDLASAIPAGLSEVEVQLVGRFRTALQRLGIPIILEDCERGLLGVYNYARNDITLCQNNLAENSAAYLPTLAHESWHVVQDYANGLENFSIAPVTFEADDYDGLEAMKASLDMNRIQTLIHHYEDEEYAFEIEAFVMEEHPELVLQVLESLAPPE